MPPKPSRSAVKAANIQRFRQMLIDLADTNGIIRGWAYWKLTNEFNERYTSETKPVNYSTIQMYANTGKAAGWLSSEQEEGGYGRLVFTLIPTQDKQSDTA